MRERSACSTLAPPHEDPTAARLGAAASGPLHDAFATDSHIGDVDDGAATVDAVSSDERRGGGRRSDDGESIAGWVVLLLRGHTVG